MNKWTRGTWGKLLMVTLDVLMVFTMSPWASVQSAYANEISSIMSGDQGIATASDEPATAAEQTADAADATDSATTDATTDATTTEQPAADVPATTEASSGADQSTADVPADSSSTSSDQQAAAPVASAQSDEGISAQAEGDGPNTFSLLVQNSSGGLLDTTNVNLGDNTVINPQVTFQAATGTTTASTLVLTLPDYYSLDDSFTVKSYGNYEITAIENDTTNNAGATRNKITLKIPASKDANNPSTVVMSFNCNLNRNTIDDTRANAERDGSWTPNGTTAIPATTGVKVTSDNNGSKTLTQDITYTLKTYTGIDVSFSDVANTVQNWWYAWDGGGDITEHGKVSYGGYKNPALKVTYALPDAYSYGTAKAKSVVITAPDGYTFLDYTPQVLTGTSGTIGKNLSSGTTVVFSQDKKTATITWADDYSDADLKRWIGFIHVMPSDSYWTQSNQNEGALIPSGTQFKFNTTVTLADGSSYSLTPTKTVYRYYGTVNEAAQEGGIKGTGSYADKVILEKVSAGSSHTTGDVSPYPSAIASFTNDKRNAYNDNRTFVPTSDGNPTTTTATIDSHILATDLTVNGDAGKFDSNNAQGNNDNGHDMATRKLSTLVVYTNLHPDGITVDFSDQTAPSSFKLSKYVTLADGEYINKVEMTYSKYSYTSSSMTKLVYSVASDATNGSLYPITYTIKTTPTNSPVEESSTMNYVLVDNSSCPTWWFGTDSWSSTDYVNGTYGDNSDGGDGFACRITDTFVGDVKDDSGTVQKSSGILSTLVNPTFSCVPNSSTTSCMSSYFTNGKIHMRAVMGTGWTATVTTISAEELKAGGDSLVGAHTYTATSPSGATDDYTWDLYSTGSIPSDQIITGVVISKQGTLDISSLSNKWDGSTNGVAVDKTLFSFGMDKRETVPLTGLYYGADHKPNGVVGFSPMYASGIYTNGLLDPTKNLFSVKYDNCADVDGRHSQTGGYPVVQTTGIDLKGADLLTPSKVSTTWSGTIRQDAQTTLEADVSLTAACYGSPELYSVSGDTFYLKLSNQEYVSFVPGTAKVDGVSDPDATVVEINGSKYLKIANRATEATRKAVTSGTGTNGTTATFEPWKVTFDVYSSPTTPTNTTLQLVENSGSWLDLASGDVYEYEEDGTTHRTAIQSTHTWFAAINSTWASTVGRNSNCKDDPLGLYTATAATDLNWAIPVTGLKLKPNANAASGVTMLPGVDGSYQSQVQPVKSYQEGKLTTAITIAPGLQEDLKTLESVIKIPRVDDTLTTDTTLTSDVSLYLTGPITVKADVTDAASESPTVEYSTDGGTTWLTAAEVAALGGDDPWGQVTHIRLTDDIIKAGDACTLQMPMRTEASADGVGCEGHAYMEAVYSTENIKSTSNRTNTYSFGPDVVSGTAWYDADLDGMIGASETKYANAKVELFSGDPTVAANKVGETTTDADGKYSFSTESYKDLSVVVTLPDGYKTTTYGARTDNKFTAEQTGTGSNAAGTIAAVNTGDVTGLDVGITPRVILSYDGNEATSGSAPVAATDYDSGDTVTVADNTGATVDPAVPYVKTGYTFAGWNTQANGGGTAYAAGDTFDITESTTLYAQWTKDVTTALNGTKSITGATTPTNDVKTFSFDMAAGDDDTRTAITDGDIVMPESTSATCQASSATAGTITFSGITFKKVGTYTFDLTEGGTMAAGYTKDSRTVTATVVVTRNTANELVAAITYAGGSDETQTAKATFANAYAVTATTSALTGTKTVTGDPTVSAKDFTFTVTPKTGDTTGYTMPTSTSATASGVQTGTDGTFTFGDITFTKAGTYTFEITEDDLPATGFGGYTKDGRTVTATVTVTDTASVLSAAVTYAGGSDSTSTDKATFENTYGVAPVTVNSADKAGITKTVTGDTPETMPTFTYTCVADQANPDGVTGLKTSATTTGAGTTDFGKATFTKAGVYKYTISETDDAPDTNWTYSTATYTWTVTVTNDNGTLEAAQTLVDANGDAADGVAFTNDYSIPILGITKASDVSHAKPGVPITYTVTVANTGHRVATNVVTVDTLPETLTNVTDISDNGVYDADAHTITWTDASVAALTGSVSHTYKASIADDATAGSKVTNTAAITGGPSTTTDVTVDALEPIKQDPPVAKTITGDTLVYDVDFSFTMTAANATDPMPEGSTDGSKTVTRTGAGAVEFGEISYDKVGTYTYTISEKDDGAEGFTYSTTVYTMTVTVTNDAGTLEKTVTYKDADGVAATDDTMTFDNGYTLPTTSITGTKVWADNSDADGTRPEIGSTAAPQLTAANDDESYVAVTTDPASGPTYDWVDNGDGTWTWTITGLEKFDSNGEPIDWYATEQQVDGYDAPSYVNDGTFSATTDKAYDGGTITNTQAGMSDVVLTKAVDNATAKPGDTVTYTLTATNNGTKAAVGYWVKDYVPENTTYVSCDDTGTYGATLAGREYVNWFFESLPAGESRTMTLTVKINECQDGTEVANVALGEETGKTTPPADPGATNPAGNPSNKVNLTVENPTPGVTSVTGSNGSTPGGLAKTGDSTNALFLSLMATAGLVVVGWGLRRRRREE